VSELIRVPDIGSGEGEVIELFVKVGDTVEADQSILTLESDKASMEIPAPKAGVVKSLKVKLGDRLKEGDELLELEIEGAADAAPAPAAAPAAAWRWPEQWSYTGYHGRDSMRRFKRFRRCIAIAANFCAPRALPLPRWPPAVACAAAWPAAVARPLPDMATWCLTRRA